jgi:hypothetical protein
MFSALAASVVLAACGAPARERAPDPRCGDALDGRADEAAASQPGWMAVPRAVLWVPRAASRAVFWPVVTTGDLVEHNHVMDWLTAILTTDDHRVGVRPEIVYSTSFLPTGGLRLFYRRLPGEGSEIVGRFLTAGPSVLYGELQLHGPDRWGLTLDASFNRRDDRLFAGVGPNSASDLAAQGWAAARYGSDIWLAELRWRRPLPAVPHLVPTVHGDLQRRDYQADAVRGGPSVVEVFGPALAELPGFYSGLRMAHAGGGLALDLRNHARDGSGVTVAADATYGHGVAGDPTQDLLVSGETVLALGFTDRLLLLRGRAAMVQPMGGTTTLPFDELVTPSGGAGMRGFPEGRFRGESGIVGTAEYRYYIASSMDAALFTDVGTVAGRRFSGLRGDRWFPTFGLGIRIYQPSGPHWEAPARTGIQVAYAPDAGVRVMLTLAGF